MNSTPHTRRDRKAHAPTPTVCKVSNTCLQNCSHHYLDIPTHVPPATQGGCGSAGMGNGFTVSYLTSNNSPFCHSSEGMRVPYLSQSGLGSRVQGSILHIRRDRRPLHLPQQFAKFQNCSHHYLYIPTYVPWVTEGGRGFAGMGNEFTVFYLTSNSWPFCDSS